MTSDIEFGSARCSSTDKVIKTQIIQPLVPSYRVPLFRSLSVQPSLTVRIAASPQVPARDDLISSGELPFADLDHVCRGILGNRFFWQQGLTLQPDMGKGDVVVVNGDLRWLSNYPLLIKARTRKIGIVWWTQGRSRSSSPLLAAIRWQLMQWTDAVLLYTDQEVEQLAQRGFPREKLFATNNAIDTESVWLAMARYNPDQLKTFRSTQKLKHPFFLYCGRLKPESRLDIALNAVAALNRQGSSCDLVVIGEGRFLDKLQNLAGDLGIEQKVRWLGGMYDQLELAPWFMTARAFVYPGPIGLSLIHAMAYGLPVVTHNNYKTHKPEIWALEEGRNGLTFLEGNADDLTRVLDSLLQNQRFQSKLSRNALDTVRDRYSIANMVDRFVCAVNYASAHARKRS